MKRFTILAALALAVSMTACSIGTPVNPATLPPGFYNSTDLGLYKALVAVEGTLSNLRATIVNPATTAQTVDVLKPYLNQAITDYDIAEVAWQTYYATLASNPNASTANVQSAIAKVQNDLQNTPKVTP